MTRQTGFIKGQQLKLQPQDVRLMQHYTIAARHNLPPTVHEDKIYISGMRHFWKT